MKNSGGMDMGYEITLEGVVQGVGMRPFIYRLAREMGIRGWVSNTGEGVRIYAEGGDLECFVRRIREEKPSLAVITCLDVRCVEGGGAAEVRAAEVRAAEVRAAKVRAAKVRAAEEVCAGECGGRGFEILASCEAEVPNVLISPDVAVCAECLAEIYDPGNRRYGYAFTNCTNCGPRYTIVKDRPYDRKRTTMAGFALCDACAEEYRSAGDRRFHAQPVACPVCGPCLEFVEGVERHQPIERCRFPEELGMWKGFGKGLWKRIRNGNEALDEARQLLKRGGILAVKGLGGYHLACDATHNGAVRMLRRRKERGAKPFAVMAGNKEMVKKVAFLSDLEEAWLTSAAAPIVLLQRRRGSPMAMLDERAMSVPVEDVSPGLDTLGVMLPYTPLHALLMEGMFEFLVLTSANLSGQPLIYQDDEALDKLRGVADGFLRHDREIFHPCDDSVVRQIGGDMTFYRRARGYVPLPLTVPALTARVSLLPELPAVSECLEAEQGFSQSDSELRTTSLPTSILAVGADMKNAFCFLEGDRAFMSPYLGEMSDKMSFDRFRQEVLSWQALLHVEPDTIVHDAHPDYVTARWAQTQTQNRSQNGCQCQFERRCEVYHHHAHLVSVMGEHGLTQPTLGLIADGTGYGTDGRIWGCEVLFGDARFFERLAHLQYLPLPGGDAGIKYPLRTAYAYFVALQMGEGWEDLTVWENLTMAEREMLKAQVATGIQVGMTSSAGRLFDVMAALLGVCHEVTYEAQGAMELENLAWRWEWGRRRRLGYEHEHEYEQEGKHLQDWQLHMAHQETSGFYPLTWRKQFLEPEVWSSQRQRGQGGADVLELDAFFAALWHDLKANQNPDVEQTSELAWKCHGSLAWGLGNYVEQIGADEKKVVLAGGVFQNKLLTEMLEDYLVTKGWTVYRGKHLPPGDGGVALGQALVARG
ncbi:MAG: carbamoyltransferase HypF [Peptococcaceae bacterium]|nr:carbamoyltransferase HypF [Peptococcaceae bacterium]